MSGFRRGGGEAEPGELQAVGSSRGHTGPEGAGTLTLPGHAVTSLLLCVPRGRPWGVARLPNRAPFRKQPPPFLSATLCPVPEWARVQLPPGGVDRDPGHTAGRAAAGAWGWKAASLGAPLPKVA